MASASFCAFVSALAILGCTGVNALVEIAAAQGQTASESPAGSKANCSCFCVIRKLANKYANQLGKRGDLKIHFAQQANDTGEFIQIVTEKAKRVGVDGLESSNTASWVTEVFEGLGDQFEEYQNRRTGAKAGYGNYIGHEAVGLFEEHKASSQRIIYHLQHIGASDHVFVIEQVPKAFDALPGYRIYQSNDRGAYNIRAWLSPQLSKDLYENKDVRLDSLTHCISENRSDDSAECVELRGYFDELKKNLAGKGKAYDAYIEYLEATSTEFASKEFETAYIRWGGGRLIHPNEFFASYLNTTTAITQYLNDVANTTTPFSKEIYDQWVELYGSTNPLYYPDVPADSFKNLARAIDYPKAYAFEAKAVRLDDKADTEAQNAACRRHAYILKDSFTV